MAGISDIIGNVKGWFQEKMKPQPRPEDEGKTFGQGEFYYDDPQLIEFIQRRADQNGTSYQEELMKYVEEVEGFYNNKNKSKKEYEIDREKIYKDLMSYYDGEISADDFQKKTGFQVPSKTYNFDESFPKLMEELTERGYTGLGGTSLINEYTESTYADGGIASIRDFTAGGHAMGPGTGTSDSIPAFLSDGEFVMTAKAVKGFGGGNREKGAQKLYSMMEKAENSARNTRRS